MAITNTRGVIATLCPANTTEATLYTVPAGTIIDGILRIVNISTEIASYSLAHCHAGHGDNASDNTDKIGNSILLLPNSVPHEFPVFAKATEVIRVKSFNANCINFHLSGNSEVTS